MCPPTNALIAGLVSFGLASGASAAGYTVPPMVQNQNSNLHLAQVVGPSVGGTPAAPPDDGGRTGPSAAAPTGRSSLTDTLAPPGAPVSSQVTQAVVSQISQTSKVCEAVSATYRVDCLGKQLESISKRLPSTGDYSEAKEVLKQASAELQKLSRQNRDRAEPRVRVKLPESSGGAITPPLSAVKKESLASTNAQAIDILNSATTVLLRSSEKDSERSLQYQRIAEALDSNKVLLRS